MGKSDASSTPFGVSGSVNGAYITADNQPIVYITRDAVDPGLTPWFSQRPGESLSLIMLHSGRRTHLAAQTCYEQSFPAG